MNNCCPTDVIMGATFIDVTLLRPTLMQPTLTAAILNGGVTLDTATANDIAQQICGHMESCISDVVNGGVFSDVTLNGGNLYSTDITNAKFHGAVQIDPVTAVSFANALCDALQDCIIAAVESTVLRHVRLDAPSITGSATFDATASQQIVNAIQDLLRPIMMQWLHEAPEIINPRIDGGQIHSATASNMQLVSAFGTSCQMQDTQLIGSTTIIGPVTMDLVARDHMCQALTPCINERISSAVNPFEIAGVFQDCQGVPRGPGTRLPSCSDMNVAIELAIKSLPALDVISGIEFDEERMVLIIKTKLDDGTEQFWEVHLDSLGGQVLTDGITITGTGTTGSPISLILNETSAPIAQVGDELPTNIIGGRGSLLGTPDTFLNINGYIIPAYFIQP